MNTRALGAEFIGTFTLVCAIAGASLAASGSAAPALTISLVIGLTILAMTHALIDVSGAHFNPAVTLGLVAGGRFDAGDGVRFIIAQIAGAIAAMALFTWILAASDPALASKLPGLANNYGTSGNPPLFTVAAIEITFTALFLIIFMGATTQNPPEGSPALAIGFGFAALYFIAISFSHGSLNPARSTATAIFANTKALSQLWLFWVAPITGGIIGGLCAKWLFEE